MGSRIAFRESSPRHHRLSVHLNNVFDDEYTSHIGRGTEDVGGDSFVVHDVGEPRTVFVSYTYSLN